jgi:histidinol phosphatase-like enzyme
LLDEFSVWKLYAFLQIVDEFKDCAMANIIAIGDNQSEIDAAINLSK